MWFSPHLSVHSLLWVANVTNVFARWTHLCLSISVPRTLSNNFPYTRCRKKIWVIGHCESQRRPSPCTVHKFAKCWMIFKTLSPRHSTLSETKWLCLQYSIRLEAQSSSERQPNFAALNRGRHLCSAGPPPRWALAHISSFISFNSMKSNLNWFSQFFHCSSHSNE